ncbi:MAG: hypothetical protein JSW27_01910, partial [Phycisphaerales bacterium]
GDVFRASDILPREAIEGPNYGIADAVSVEAYQYVFTVDSGFGQLTAKGRDVLNLRLRELKSIDAAKKLAKDPLLVNGILGPLENTARGAELFISQPLETLGRVPKGFGLMVSQFLDPADRRAGSLERRKLAAELDCDPETRNPVLKKLLDDMSLQYGGGGLLTKAAMSFVPGLSLLPTTAEMKETIASNPPSAINDQIRKELEMAGVEKTLRSRFCKSKAFTAVQRLLVMYEFRALEDVPGRETLIEATTHADTESEALSTIRGGEMIVDLGKRKMIRELTFVGLPMAVLGDGTHVIICPYDYITNTEELIQGVNAYRTSHPQVKTVLATTGDASAAARRTLEAARIEIVEERLVDQ